MILENSLELAKHANDVDDDKSEGDSDDSSAGGDIFDELPMNPLPTTQTKTSLLTSRPSTKSSSTLTEQKQDRSVFFQVSKFERRR